jgi:hypothetical protein
MNAIFKGIRPLDYLLAALATGAGVYLMHENMTASGHGLAHPPANCTTSSAMRSASWSFRPPRASAWSAATRTGPSPSRRNRW